MPVFSIWVRTFSTVAPAGSEQLPDTLRADQAIPRNYCQIGLIISQRNSSKVWQTKNGQNSFDPDKINPSTEGYLLDIHGFLAKIGRVF